MKRNQRVHSDDIRSTQIWPMKCQWNVSVMKYYRQVKITMVITNLQRSMTTMRPTFLSKIPPTYPWKIPRMFHQQFMKELLSLWGCGEVWGIYLPRVCGQNHWFLVTFFGACFGFFETYPYPEKNLIDLESQINIWAENKQLHPRNLT